MEAVALAASADHYRFRCRSKGQGWFNDDAADDYAANEHGMSTVCSTPR